MLAPTPPGLCCPSLGFGFGQRVLPRISTDAQDEVGADSSPPSLNVRCVAQPSSHADSICVCACVGARCTGSCDGSSCIGFCVDACCMDVNTIC